MKNITNTIVPVLQKYGVKKASLFGSYARGTQDEYSDFVYVSHIRDAIELPISEIF